MPLLTLDELFSTEEQAPIIYQDEHKIIFHSMNFCQTLEACELLALNTGSVCRCYNEGSTDTLVKRVDPRLSFKRNCKNFRPSTVYCEEMIVLEEVDEEPG